MLKKIIFVTLLSVLFFSCGGGDSSGSSGDGGGGDDPDPSICSVIPRSTSLKNKIFNSSFTHPFSTSFLKMESITHRNKVQNKNLIQNLKIVGGDTIPSGTNCQASGLATGSGYNTIATTNTVGIVINGNELCSGTLVTSDLILTAAHCFDNFAVNGSSPSSVVIHFSQDALTSTNTTTAIAWGRSPGHDRAEPSTYANVLNDIAWIKITPGIASGFGYLPVNVLANPQTALSATEEKLSIGFGKTTDFGTADGLERCVSTYADANYATRGDVSPTGVISIFDSQTSANAYEHYLTVIGPINGADYGGTSRGTCFGDSGGPTYVYRSGSWVLAALTQGTNNILSPKPTINFTAEIDGSTLGSSFDSAATAACSDGYGDYTTVGNYAAWLAEPSTAPCYGAGETITTQ
ncbi:MAG: trypsin-like serine protease [Bdellovibrionota bacterium]